MTAGLRLRDIRSVDPSLWVTNSAPAILVSGGVLASRSSESSMWID